MGSRPVGYSPAVGSSSDLPADLVARVIHKKPRPEESWPAHGQQPSRRRRVDPQITVQRGFPAAQRGSRSRGVPLAAAQFPCKEKKGDSFITFPTFDPTSARPPAASRPTNRPNREGVPIPYPETLTFSSTVRKSEGCPSRFGGVTIEMPSEKLSRISTCRMAEPEMHR
jgi:hypothetical protein